jgi:hypothetical protein
MEYERLSRGDEMDAAFVLRIFRQAQVLIHTPQRTYDPNDEDEGVLVGVMAILARREYQRTKRRFSRGKREGAAMGRWTQGKPPFPYEYDRANKRVVVNEAKRPFYERMLDDALAGDSLHTIAINLNLAGSRGDRGKPWEESSVQNVILNRFHLGEVIYNKTRREGKKVTRLPESEWIRGVGDHERLITHEQYDRITALVTARSRIANRSKAGTFPLSGLVKCALCGHTHTTAEKRGRHVLYSCGTKSPMGELCPNAGVKAAIIYEAIEVAAREEIDALNDASKRVKPRKSDAAAQLEAFNRELAEQEKRLSNLVDLATDGLIDKAQFAAKKAPIDEAIRRLRDEIVRLTPTSAPTISAEERRHYLGEIARGDWWTRPDLTDKERHRILVLLFEKVVLRSARSEGRARKVESVTVDVIPR